MRHNKDARSLSNVTLLAPPFTREPNLGNSSVNYMSADNQDWTTVPARTRREAQRQSTATSLRPSSSLVPLPQVEDSPAGHVQTPCCTQPRARSFPRGRGTTRDRPRTAIGNPISPLFILNSLSSLSASHMRSSLDILGLVTLGSASSQWARPGSIAPCFTPTRPLVRLQPKSPGDPDPEVTALGRELKNGTLESFIPRVPSDTPSDKIEAGTTGKVSFACKERGKSFTGIKVETV
jgi:hypothetical protein